ncbi:MAG: hypothetical protein E7285_02140 [Lachnospiraceae bacterium]|nr:hypothetical protein [Lachnospiraceae bacterium]
MSITKNLFRKNCHTIIAFLMLFWTSSIFYYSDIHSNIRQGINFWYALFSGDFFSYYSLNMQSVENGEMIHLANYDMVMNFFMGVWQIPLFIFEKITFLNSQDFLIGRIWGKGYLILCTLLAGNGLKKVAAELDMEQSKCENVCFMFVTSITAFFCTGVIGQGDIIAVLFSIYALLYLFQKKTAKFLLFFILAAQCKNFALFIFIPIILYKEKNILRIAFQTCLPVIITFLVELPFKLSDPIGVASKKPRFWSMIATMMERRITILGFDIPVLFILFVAICMAAYLTYETDEHKDKKWVLFYGFVSILSLFLSMYMYAYWVIYLLPFTILFFFMDEKKLFSRWFLECFAYFSLIVGYIVTYPDHFDTNNMQNMLLDKLLLHGYNNSYILNDISLFLKDYYHYNIWTLSYCVFIVWTIFISVTNCPRYVSMQASEEKNTFSLNTLLWIRAIAGFILVNIGVFFFLLEKLF